MSNSKDGVDRRWRFIAVLLAIVYVITSAAYFGQEFKAGEFSIRDGEYVAASVIEINGSESYVLGDERGNVVICAWPANEYWFKCKTDKELLGSEINSTEKIKRGLSG